MAFADQVDGDGGGGKDHFGQMRWVSSCLLGLVDWNAPVFAYQSFCPGKEGP
jgi:hypothetical protein